MKDVAKLADKIARHIERTSDFLKNNWKSAIVVLWMVFITLTLIRQKQAIEEASSYNQVANLRMSVDDVRYSVTTMEEEVEKVERSITRMDSALKGMESTVNRIHSQVRHQPES